MKKLLVALLSVFTMQVAHADNDKPVTVAQLPTKAQTFLKQNFPNEKVAFAKMEKEFLENGEWTDLKCKRGGVPAKAVPAQIAKFVSENHDGAKILKLERDRFSYEVKLSNFWEIKFDKQFNVIDMDMDD